MASQFTHTSHFGQSFGTVKPMHPFNATVAAQDLWKAFEGKGCDADMITRILCFTSNAQRQEIRREYKQKHGEDLIERLKSELKGNLETLFVSLTYTQAEYDALELYHAMKGVGTNESTLIEILATRTNAELEQTKKIFLNLYKKDLEAFIKSETSGRFQRLLVTMVQAKREETTVVDMARAKKSAQDLLNAGIAKWGTDDGVFNVILGTHSYPQLKATFSAYETLVGHSIDQAIEKEFSGDIKNCLLAIVESARNTPRFFAITAFKALKGFGTNDRKLIRVVVSRSEKDLELIKEEFPRVSDGKTLEQLLEKECSGKYRDAMLALVGHTNVMK